MKHLLFTLLLLGSFSVKGQGTIAIPISTNIFFGEEDEWVHLKITDTLTNQVWYDTLATVTVSDGFTDTLYLDSATYKCEVLSIGANVSMPNIELDDGSFAQWGYPDYEYYLFTIPIPKAGLIKQNESLNMLIYPNPFVNMFTLEVSDFLSDYVLKVRNYSGRTVLFKKITQQNSINVDLSGFPNGVYFIEIDHENYIKVEQIVKVDY